MGTTSSSEGSLPSGYTAAQYITTAGAAFVYLPIDTTIATLGVYLKFLSTNYSGSSFIKTLPFVCGVRESGYYNSPAAYLRMATGNNYAAGFGNSFTTIDSNFFSANTIYEMWLGNVIDPDSNQRTCELVVKGGGSTFRTALNNTVPSSMYGYIRWNSGWWFPIGVCYSYSSNNQRWDQDTPRFIGNFYDCKLYTSYRTVGHYIPVRQDSNSQFGFYDLISQEFRPSSSTTNFTGTL